MKRYTPLALLTERTCTSKLAAFRTFRASRQVFLSEACCYFAESSKGTFHNLHIFNIPQRGLLNIMLQQQQYFTSAKQMARLCHLVQMFV